MIKTLCDGCNEEITTDKNEGHISQGSQWAMKVEAFKAMFIVSVGLTSPISGPAKPGERP